MIQLEYFSFHGLSFFREYMDKTSVEFVHFGHYLSAVS